MGLFDSVLDNLGLMKKAAVIPSYHMQPGERERTPKFNLVKLYDVVEKNWVLQEIYRAVIQEVKRPGWDIHPKFLQKCENCGAESQYSVDKCPVCGSTNLREPIQRQLLKARRLIERPNSDRETFGDIIGSLVYHDLVADQWFLSIEYSSKNNGDLKPAEIKVRDPRHIRPIIDEFGNFGKKNEWFCPVCYNYKRNPEVYSEPGTCQECGLELQQTAYVQKVNSEITARWGKTQMVHGSTYRVLPDYFGTPRARSLWNTIHILTAMDEWFFDTFTEGRLQYIVNFPGWDQPRLTQLMKEVRAEINKMKVLDERTGQLRTKKAYQNLYLSSDDPIKVHDIGLDPKDLEALDYYKLAIMACCGVYGVQAIFISFIERGRAGTTPAMQIEVQNRTTQEIQRDKEEIINQFLFPTFGIHDFVFKFNSIEAKDERREMEIEKMKAAAAMTWRNAGFGVWLDDHGNLRKSKEPEYPPSAARPEGPTKPKQKISEASRREIEGTTTERAPHGPRNDYEVEE